MREQRTGEEAEIELKGVRGMYISRRRESFEAFGGLLGSIHSGELNKPSPVPLSSFPFK